MDTRCRDGVLDVLEFCRHVSWTTIDDLASRLGNTFYSKRTRSIAREHILSMTSPLASVHVFILTLKGFQWLDFQWSLYTLLS
jgi:hypothetical protein